MSKVIGCEESEGQLRNKIRCLLRIFLLFLLPCIQFLWGRAVQWDSHRAFAISVGSCWSLHAPDTCRSPDSQKTSPTLKASSHTHCRWLPHPSPQPQLPLESSIQCLLDISQASQPAHVKSHLWILLSNLLILSSLPFSGNQVSISLAIWGWSLTLIFHNLSFPQEIHCQEFLISPLKSECRPLPITSPDTAFISLTFTSLDLPLHPCPLNQFSNIIQAVFREKTKPLTPLL